MSLQDTEIIVVGAGIAGCAAALAASTENRKVLLVEREETIGGNATNCNVGTICGSYYRTFAEKPKLAGYKFSNEFISGLMELSVNKTPIHHHKGLYIISYDWLILRNYLEQKLKDYNISVITSSEIVNIKKDENQITNFSIKTSGKVIEIAPLSIIDSSGNGIVSQLMNLEMIASPNYQSASQIFRVEEIKSDNEFSLNMSLKKEMVKLVDAHQWPQSFASLSLVPGSLKNNCADFKITLPETITDNKEENQKVSLKAKSYVNEIFPSLTKSIESLRTSKIKTIFPQLGIRIQQRSKGKYILTEEDVLSCTKFSNGIAMGTWPIEEWQSEGKLNMEYFEPDDGYMIPADCLISEKLDNLYFAGKNISATTKAIASARVMGTCLQTGYAAGKMACCNTPDSRDKMINFLNKELVQNNE